MSSKRKISRAEFKQIYLKSVEDILSMWTPQMQDEFSRHCVNWSRDRFDFEVYLKHSEIRYWTAYQKNCRGMEIKSWCDTGGFFGAFPLALKRLGLDVTMTEALKYYSESFSPLFKYLQGEGVNVVDCDPFEENASEIFKGAKFDVVSAMAVLEHYPHSVRRFMDFLRSIVSIDGSIYLEVPNISYWPKRWAMMRGRSPLSNIEDIYKSQVPYIGHHHEYSIAELFRLADLADLNVVDQEQFNYSFVGPWIKRFISDPLLALMTQFPSMRESIGVVLVLSKNGVKGEAFKKTDR